MESFAEAKAAGLIASDEVSNIAPVVSQEAPAVTEVQQPETFEAAKSTGLVMDEGTPNGKDFMWSYDYFKGMNPDAAAIFKKVADENNMTFDQVAQNPEAWKKVNDVKQLHTALMAAPETAKWLQEPANMAVAHDDAATLANLEQMIGQFSFGEKAYKALVAGAAQLNASLIRTPGFIYNLAAFPQNAIADISGADFLRANAETTGIGQGLEQAAGMYDQIAKNNTTAAAQQSITEAVTRGDLKGAGEALALQFLQNAPNQAALLAGMMAGYGTPALIGAGVTTGASSYKEAKDAGVSDTTAVLNAIPKGAAEALFERVGTFGLLKYWEGAIAKELGKGVSANVMKEFSKTLAYSFLGEGAEESVTSVAQDLTDYLTGVNPEALTKIATRALDAGIVGGFSGTTMTGPSSIYLGVHQAAQNRQIEATKNFYDALGKNGEESKLRQRLPAEYGKIVAQLTKDGPVENIYVNIEQLEPLMQSAGVTPQDLGIEESFKAAKETGGEVKIPTAIVAEKIVGTPLYQSMAEHVKLDPNGVSAADQKNAEAKVEEIVKAEQAQTEEGVKLHETFQQMQQVVLDKVELEAGKKVSAAEAQVVAKRYLVQAIAQGVDPMQYFTEQFVNRVSFQNEGQMVQGALQQFAGEKAQGAPVDQLAVAKKMAEQGKSDEEVRKATGWFLGMDQKWRFEIDDSKAGINPRWSRANVEGEKFNITSDGNYDIKYDLESGKVKSVRPAAGMVSALVDVLKHDQLFAAYPFLKNVYVSFSSKYNSTEGGYSLETNTIRAGVTKVPSKLLDLLMHEIQHAIQEYENFASGGSPREFLPSEQEMSGLKKAMDNARSLAKDAPSAETYNHFIKQYHDLVDTVNAKNADAYAKYEKLAGEIEARDSAFRRTFNEQKRLRIPPKIDPAAIVKFRGQEQAYFVPETSAEQALGDKIAAALSENNGVTDEVVMPPTPNTFYQVQNLPEWKTKTEEWMQANGYTPKEIEKHIKAIEGQMKIFSALGPMEIEMLPKGAEMNEAPKKGKKAGQGGPIRGNSDPIYKITFDASAMCVKRLEISATVSYIQGKIGRALNADERLALIAMFKAAGKVTPCLYCYVEAPRAKMGEFVQTAAEVATGIRKVQDKWSKSMQALANAARAEATKLGLNAKDIDANVILDPAFATSKEAAAKIAAAPVVYDFVKKMALAAKANLPKLYEEYKGQILDIPDALLEELNGYAGMRFFSSSDFQAEHVVDLMQAVYDLDLRKAKAHVYTKVKEFVEIFGKTGMKIQTSVFAKMGPNGEILMDAAEGMDWTTAQEFRKQFPNVGTCLVATSDEIVRWGLDQPWIDYIIPFHASGLKKEMFRELGWENYTSTQSEKWLEPSKHKGQKVPKIRMHELGVAAGVTNADAKARYEQLLGERGLQPVFPQFFDHPEYFKLKKDYARTDTAFNPVKAEFDMAKADEVMQKYLAGETPTATADKGMGDQFIKAVKKGAVNGLESVKRFMQTPAGVPQGAKGQIQFTADNKAIITFFKADQSTFMHEMAHLWLSDMMREKSGDWATVAAYLNIKEDQTELTVEQQEKFARSFEAYLREGNAPSVGLKRAFSNFRRWLTKIYKMATQLDVEISDDIRGVFDRMLATEEEIAFAELQAGKTKEGIAKGLDPKVAEKLLDLETEAHEMAVNAILSEQLHQLTEKGKAELELKRKNAEFQFTQDLKKSESRLTIDAIKYTFKADPDKLAEQFMMDKMDDKTRAHWELVAETRGYRSGEEMAQAVLRTKPLEEDVKAAVDAYMAQFSDLLNPAALREKAIAAIHNEQKTKLLAVESEVLKALIRKQAAKVETQNQNEEAKAAAKKTEEIANKMAFEGYLAKATAAAALAQAKAQSILGKLTIRESAEFMPYFTAERNAAERVAVAIKAKDYAEAAKWKEKQLLNHALAQQAFQNKKILDKTLSQIKDVATRKKSLFKDEDNFVQAAAMLERFGFGTRKDYDPKNKQESLKEWSDRMDAVFGNDQGAGDSPVSMPDWIMNESDRREFRKLTLEELVDVKDALKNIVRVGNAVDTFFVLAEKGKIQDTAAKLAAELDKNVDGKKTLKTVEGKLDKIGQLMSSYNFSLKTFDTIINIADGFKDFGKFFDTLSRPVKEAADRESKIRREAETKLKAIFKRYTPKERKAFGHMIYVPEFGAKMTKKELLAMALNLGTESNRDRLFETAPVGFNSPVVWDRNSTGYDRARVENVVLKALSDRFSEKDWETVQEVWDLLESYWPDVSAMHKDMTGFAPKKLERLPFTVVLPDGSLKQMKGGYYALKPDNRSFEKAAVNEAMDVPLYKDMNAGWRAATKTGHTKTRTGVAYSVALDLGWMTQQLNDVVHDLAFRPLIYDMNRLVKNTTFQSALKRNLGMEGKAYFDQYVRALASGGNTERLGTDFMSATLRAVNNRVSTAVVMGRVSVILQNFANPFLAPNRVEGFGAVDTLKGMLGQGIGKYWIYNTIPGLHKKARQMQEFVWSKSSFMRDRRGVPEYSLQDVKGTLLEDKNFAEFMLGLIAGTDDMTNIPLWMQAFNKKLEETQDEKKAIEYADLLVLRTTGSGRKYDVAKVLRGSDTERLFSKLYSFWSVEMNNWTRELGKLKKQPPQNAARFAGFVLSRVLFAITSAAIVGQLPGGDDDKEKEKWLKIFLSYPVSFFPMFREVGNAVIDHMLDLPNFGIRPAPATSLPETILQVADGIEKWAEKNDPQPAMESASKLAAYAFNYPDQFNAWFWNAYDYMQNNMDFQASDLMKRRPRKER